MRNKSYLLIDCYSNIEEIKTFKQLKELHINEIMNDLLDNIDDLDIVKIDTDTLGEYAKGKEPTLKEIKENLEGYGYKIKDLNNLKIIKENK